MTISWFHFVRIEEIPRWEELGWRATGDLQGTGHGDYSDILRWDGEGTPVVPLREHAT